MIYSIVIAIFFSIFSLIFTKSKLITILFFIFIWLLMGWNFWNGDYELYKEMYDYNDASSLIVSNYEFGYKYIMSMFLAKGKDFQYFFTCMSFLILLIFLIFILKFSKLPALVTTIFFLIFLPLDYVLLRNTIAFIIMLVAFAYLLKNIKNNKLIFIILVLLAGTIHFSAFFYIIFLLAFRVTRISVIKVFIAIGVLLILYIVFKNILYIYFPEVELRSNIYKNTWIMFFLYSTFQIINYFIIKLYTENQLNQSKTLNINIVIYNINTLLLFLIVFYFDMTIFVRIFRNIAFINIIYMTNFLYINRRNQRISMYIAVFIIYLMFFYVTFILPVLDDSMFALFKYNLLFRDL